MSVGRVLAIIRCLVYAGFIFISLRTFFVSKDELGKTRDHLSKIQANIQPKIQKVISKIDGTQKSTSSEVNIDTSQIYCPLSSDTNLLALSFDQNRYFLVLQTISRAFPVDRMWLVEDGNYLVKGNELWLLDSLGKTLKRLKIESRKLDGKETLTLNFFGDLLSFKYCLGRNKKALENFKTVLQGQYFPKNL